MSLRTSRYRIGVIGAGARGETFARQLYAGSKRAELFGVCDINVDRLGKFCDYCELTNTQRFTDPEKFLNHPDLDAVIVTTPDFTHGDVATAAMEAGKHIYLEKPIAHTVEDCYRIIDTQRRTGMTAYVGFNLRVTPHRQKLHDIVQSGMLGQIVHIEGLEQLHRDHGASFTRRFHRKSANTGGLLNHKCSHDIDILLWTIGHQHKVVRVASFGGTNVFTHDKQPAPRCSVCPPEYRDPCPYTATPGFVFPVHGNQPIYHEIGEIYGGDTCVFTDDKDVVDNQTVILEWDNGVRGNFNLQMFQYMGVRENRVWGEHGFAELDGLHSNAVRVRLSDTGDTLEYGFGKRSGGHGGSDPMMIGRLIDAIEGKGDAYQSGLEEGLAATLVCIKAEEARRTGRVVEIRPDEYRDRPTKPGGNGTARVAPRTSSAPSTYVAPLGRTADD